MKKIILLLCIILTSISYSQTTWEWFELGENLFGSNRKDDLWFINPDTGWVVSGRGLINKTTDGGATWTEQFNQNTTFFRSVTFVNDTLGFAGNLGTEEFGGSGITDTNVIYRTTNSGITWEPIQNVTGPYPRGMCGMFAVDENNIYAVGRVRGPSFMMKSTDGGESWVSKDMSLYAAGLIDVFFFNPDTGFTVGLSNTLHSNSRGVILYTTNGGETWANKYFSNRTGEWAWKIQFPSRNTGYVSLQRNSGSPVNIIKTTDGGETWFEKQFFASPYFVQGIGFVNDTIGFIGGNSTQTSYQTTDGGETWEPANFGSRVNRIRFVNDTLGYATGGTVYKFILHPKVSNIKFDENFTPEEFSLYQNFPNPFNPSTTIRYAIPQEGFVSLKLFDITGREIATLVNETKSAGIHQYYFNTENFNNKLSSTVYLYKLEVFGEGSEQLFSKSRKFIIMK